ncbi:UNVERIFIED_CONTAM: hypothetical protein Sradi_0175300 [Sesamum radiatum]|uniref:Reverse transcriptase zinc-binding domain-containing protein n=1 Tax=Sesamum radiatum TaxID=300843 RepID=A0AAW2VYE7_SESRA
MSEVVVGCVLCGSDEESAIHVLLRCSFARQVWALSNLPWSCIHRDAEVNCEWVWQTYSAVGKRMGDQFLMVCWALWKHRNGVVMERISQTPLQVVRGELRFQTEYVAATQGLRLPSTISIQE